MHQTDTLFHKKKAAMAFMFGGEADNHAINTVPKETYGSPKPRTGAAMGKQFGNPPLRDIHLRKRTP
jgi:nitrate reductase alpha subunit